MDSLFYVAQQVVLLCRGDTELGLLAALVIMYSGNIALVVMYSGNIALVIMYSGNIALVIMYSDNIALVIMYSGNTKDHTYTNHTTHLTNKKSKIQLK